MTNPITDPYFILSKVYSQGAYLKQAIAETPIEPLNKARTVKICYGVLENEIFLSKIIEINCEKSPKTSVKTVLKIAIYMLEFMGKKNYMVVDYAVELVKKLGKSGASGFVNAFLRGYKLPDEPENETDRLSLKYSYPSWLIKRLRRSYKKDTESIISQKSLGVCVRFVRDADKYLSLPHEETPFDNVYIFKNFVRDEGFFAGDYTFQSVGSVAIASAVLPCKNFLDACSAPGGKAVFIADKCENVTACEIHPHRVKLIEEYAARMGKNNVKAVLCDSAIFNRDYERAFDGVLCDVPCSGTGVINENPDIALSRQEQSVAELCELQLKILKNCAKYVKSGGKLYYSTCSILPEENDSVVYAFLDDEEDFELSVPFSPLPSQKTKYGLQFLPNLSLGAGFYLTCFERK